MMMSVSHPGFSHCFFPETLAAAGPPMWMEKPTGGATQSWIWECDQIPTASTTVPSQQQCQPYGTEVSASHVALFFSF